MWMAERVSRNVPLRRDPEHFHIEKSCITQDLEYLATMLDEQSAQITVNRRRRTLGGHRVTVSL